MKCSKILRKKCVNLWLLLKLNCKQFRVFKTVQNLLSMALKRNNKISKTVKCFPCKRTQLIGEMKRRSNIEEDDLLCNHRQSLSTTTKIFLKTPLFKNRVHKRTSEKLEHK